MKDVFVSVARGLAIGALFCAASAVSADETKVRAADKDPGAGMDKAADNTGKNRRDRKEGEPTADQQKNNRSDLETTRLIRRALVKDKSLSMSAHNVKIIAQNGAVTLKGPVKSDDEKRAVEQKAAEVAGQANVKSEIEVAPK